jgi:hypothetical protein
MANLGDLKSSKFLKKEDVGVGALCTIHAVKQENVAKEGVEPEMKWCLYLDEFEKPMVLNSTNGQAIAKITGHEEDIETTWVGAKIVLFDDPNVSFGGKITGGIRIRAPKSQQAKDLPF